VATRPERDGVAVDAPDRSAPYSYRGLYTKSGGGRGTCSVIGYYTHPGGTVAVITSRSPTELVSKTDSADPVLAVPGGTLLGATVTVTAGRSVDTDILARPAGPDRGLSARPSSSAGTRVRHTFSGGPRVERTNPRREYPDI
jgi:hypothetical protein